ncbi:unnamed protein product [Darwinula stevensoni]|uniref:DDE-1 domain-containing protein n=1 Tax=Darwinula stevensoni TaxID=69355 RepID=A0A7R9A6L8_9CRUS|nr:unnamed protein product [Darwinula stevensoni]CAG0889649.1 unnamed protein product [Darwinula stevensoni]
MVNVIEIHLTPEDFGNFAEKSLKLRVGHGYKDDFPFGNDETILHTFEGPVEENTTVLVEYEDAWVDVLTRKQISPFKVFYNVESKAGNISTSCGGNCMHDETATTGILEPCVGDNGQVPSYQQCLWNIRGSPKEVIEILLTPEDFGNFSDRSLLLRVGHGYKDDFPLGNEETILNEFDGPVEKNTTVLVEYEDAWVDMLTRKEIYPFKQCLWNIRGSPTDAIEILLTPEDFGNFSNRSLLLRVGHGYKVDFPLGNDETILHTFEGPVEENTTVLVEYEDAWVDVLTRKEIYPFKQCLWNIRGSPKEVIEILLTPEDFGNFSDRSILLRVGHGYKDDFPLGNEETILHEFDGPVEKNTTVLVEYEDAPTDVIEILLTPEDFGNFTERSLVLRVGYGYKDDFPLGNEETILRTFDSPVKENTTVLVEYEDAWVDLLTRKEIYPFRVFYTVRNETENKVFCQTFRSFEMVRRDQDHSYFLNMRADSFLPRKKPYYAVGVTFSNELSVGAGEPPEVHLMADSSKSLAEVIEGISPTDVIEILLTPEDFGNFTEMSLVLRVGYGYKDDFPIGSDETILETFEGPVEKNTTVLVEREDAWVHMLTREKIYPFRVFYTIKTETENVSSTTDDGPTTTDFLSTIPDTSCEGLCMYDETATTGILEPCVDDNGLVPQYQQCLWNIRGSPTDTIEILLTPEDFGNFTERSLLLRVGYGYKDDFPIGNDETILETFEGPVEENTTVLVEREDAWVHMLTRVKIYPFKVFYTIRSDTVSTCNVTMTPTITVPVTDTSTTDGITTDSSATENGITTDSPPSTTDSSATEDGTTTTDSPHSTTETSATEDGITTDSSATEDGITTTDFLHSTTDSSATEEGTTTTDSPHSTTETSATEDGITTTDSFPSTTDSSATDGGITTTGSPPSTTETSATEDETTTTDSPHSTTESSATEDGITTTDFPHSTTDSSATEDGITTTDSFPSTTDSSATDGGITTTDSLHSTTETSATEDETTTTDSPYSTTESSATEDGITTTDFPHSTTDSSATEDGITTTDSFPSTTDSSATDGGITTTGSPPSTTETSATEDETTTTDFPHSTTDSSATEEGTTTTDSPHSTTETSATEDGITTDSSATEDGITTTDFPHSTTDSSATEDGITTTDSFPSTTDSSATDGGITTTGSPPSTTETSATEDETTTTDFPHSTTDSSATEEGTTTTDSPHSTTETSATEDGITTDSSATEDGITTTDFPHSTTDSSATEEGTTTTDSPHSTTETSATEDGITTTDFPHSTTDSSATEDGTTTTDSPPSTTETSATDNWTTTQMSELTTEEIDCDDSSDRDLGLSLDSLSCESFGNCIQNVTGTSGILEPCVDASGIVPQFQSSPTGVMEILLTPENFWNFTNGTLQLRIGYGYKEDFPQGADETQLASFDAPVTENVTVNVECDDTWVHMMTFEAIYPFSVFYYAVQNEMIYNVTMASRNVTMTVPMTEVTQHPNTTPTAEATQAITTESTAEETELPTTIQPLYNITHQGGCICAVILAVPVVTFCRWVDYNTSDPPADADGYFGMNTEEVKKYFNLLSKKLDDLEIKMKPHRIFNADECGLQMNTAAGSYLPPVVIFKGKRHRRELGERLPPGSMPKFSESGYINTALFMEFLEFFVAVVHSTVEAPVLIIDGHDAHATDPDLLQSLFKPLKYYYYKAAASWAHTHGGKAFTKLEFGGLLREGWFQAATVGNAVNGFKACGIYPFNPSAILGNAFHQTAPSPERQNVEATNLDVSNSDPLRITPIQPANRNNSDEVPSRNHRAILNTMSSQCHLCRKQSQIATKRGGALHRT